MSEQYIQPGKDQFTAARNLERIQNSKDLLSPSGKELAEIHPIVTDFVETNTKDVDFGRIRDVADAHDIALRQEKLIKEGLDRNLQAASDYAIGVVDAPRPEATIDELDARVIRASYNEQLDRDISDAVFRKVRGQEAEKYNSDPEADSHSNAELEAAVRASHKIAERAATDFQLTQGNKEASERRFYRIYDDIAKQNPGITGSEIGKMIDSAQHVAREVEEKTKQ